MRALKRIEIEDSGPNPERLAEAIHLQLQHSRGPVPAYEIAKALDIVDCARPRGVKKRGEGLLPRPSVLTLARVPRPARAAR